MVILLSEAKAARATLKAWVFFGVRRFGADGEIQLQASRVNLDRLQLLHLKEFLCLVMNRGSMPRLLLATVCMVVAIPC